MEFFLMNLLSEAGGSGNAQADNGSWTSFILIGVLVVAFVVMMVVSGRNNKKRQQEQEAVMNSIRPGNKVKTIGGICGIVVEVNEEENTFVLETGNELNGKSYLKFDKQAIYQTDAKVETKDAKAEEKTEDKTEEVNTEEK